MPAHKLPDRIEPSLGFRVFHIWFSSLVLANWPSLPKCGLVGGSDPLSVSNAPRRPPAPE